MRIDRVVVGMDFSAAAVSSAMWVARSFASHAAMVLVHAIEPPPPPPPGFAQGSPAEPVDQASPARKRAQERLAELARQLRPVAVEVVIRIGRADEVIASVAAERDADLVVVGAHGESPRRWNLLGTTADRLVRTSTVPVLVAPNAVAGSARRLLVCTDGSSVTRRLLRWARDIAEANDAEVTLLNVWRAGAMSHVMSFALATMAPDDAAGAGVDDDLKADALHWLEALAETGIGRAGVRAFLATGRPGDAILATAEILTADLIVMGRRGTGQVAPMLLGSTVRTVLHGAPCPVLVVTG